MNRKQLATAIRELCVLAQNAAYEIEDRREGDAIETLHAIDTTARRYITAAIELRAGKV